MKTAQILYGCLIGLIVLLLFAGCPPAVEGACSQDSPCVDGYLCNKQNQCVEADPLSVASDKISDAVVHEKYSWIVVASGGIKPYVWSIQSDLTWPSINKQTGEITGTPASCIKDASIKVSVTDNSIGSGTSVEKTFGISVVICIPNDDHSCSGRGICDNANTEPVCVCNQGYKGETCKMCAQGFQWNETGDECIDIDECFQSQQDCHETLANCINIPGSYTCECKQGFQGDGKQCTDINECDIVPQVCEGELLCVNTVGSYQCVKPNGFECQDPQECASGHCVEDVCCESSCTEPCYSCAMEGDRGLCKGVFPGVDPTGKCGICHTCDAMSECKPLDDVAAPATHCPDTEDECGDTGRCVAGVCEKQPQGFVCNDNELVCDNTDPLNPVVTVFYCDGQGECVDQTQSCNGHLCASAEACHEECDIPGCAQGYTCVKNVCTRWLNLTHTSYNWCSDLVADGEYLYRVGGCGGWPKTIYRYAGPPNTNWDLVSDQNPTGGYAHTSPGEGNRSWMHAGKIILAGHSHSSPSHPGSKNVVIYDVQANTWSVHDLPVFEAFNGFGRGGVLNAQKDELFISWTEESHLYATAVLDIKQGLWSEHYDREDDFGKGYVALEDTSGRYVFDLVQEEQYLRLRIYDLNIQPDDFTGTWTDAIHDMGPGGKFLEGHTTWDHGCDNMAWDPESQKLFLVGTKNGTTLVYDPTTDTWDELDRRPVSEVSWHDGSLATVGGWLYSQVGNEFWALDLSPWQ